MKRMIDSLRALWSSVAFRLTLNYSLFALSTSLVLLAFFYHQTVQIQESQFSRQVATTAQRMSAHFEQGGPAGLINEINLELADHVNPDTEMFLLIGRHGKVLAGNIESDPVLMALQEEGIKHEVTIRGVAAHGYFVARRLPDDSMLIVGHDLRDLQEIKQLTKRVSIAATCVTAMLVLLGAYLFRRALQRRVEIIRRTATQVGAGQLKQRIPVGQRQDEFGLLTRDINTMLDRIELLMQGVRNVSDSVAHHLRTPLTRMLTRVRTALQPGRSYDELRASMIFLADEIEDLAKISEKLLRIAELESGTRRKKFETVSLNKVARDVVDLYEAVAEEKQASLLFSSTGKPDVHGDPDLLAGAIANLLDNAIKYAGAGARIHLTVTEASGEVTVSVTDNGPGISRSKHQRIGERFYRLNSDVPGYGLGLATVIAIARLHNASFELRDADPGLGVSLRFMSPVVCDHDTTSLPSTT